MGLLLFLASCLSVEKGVRGQMERLEENISDILWLTDGRALMRTSYTDMHQKSKGILSSIMASYHPLADLCKHFNI